MKPMYYRMIRGRAAVSDLVEIESGVFLVTRLNVPKELRKRGIGTSIMNEITSDADKDGIVLKIEPSPYPDSDMSRKQLVNYYKKFGFKFISYDDYMVREPLLCYMTLEELRQAYSNIREGIKPSQLLVRCVKFLTLLNENDVQYPYTLVVITDKCFNAFDNWLVDKKIDFGHPDMYMLTGREREVAAMMPIVVEVI